MQHANHRAVLHATEARHGDAAFDTITAQRLKIVNDDGKTVVELNQKIVDAVGGAIFLSDNRGRSKISLIAGDNGSFLELKDNDGTARTHMFALGEEAGLGVRDKEGVAVQIYERAKAAWLP